MFYNIEHFQTFFLVTDEGAKQNVSPNLMFSSKVQKPALPSPLLQKNLRP
jgi:hypothetical protein